MTRGQIARIQELGKCHMELDMDRQFIEFFSPPTAEMKLTKKGEAWLRRLWYQYRYQIAAMRKNRKDS